MALSGLHFIQQLPIDLESDQILNLTSESLH
jgi:hypothetical protein